MLGPGKTLVGPEDRELHSFMALVLYLNLVQPRENPGWHPTLWKLCEDPSTSVNSCEDLVRQCVFLAHAWCTGYWLLSCLESLHMWVDIHVVCYMPKERILRKQNFKRSSGFIFSCFLLEIMKLWPVIV